MRLSATGLANIAESKVENDFTFIVGNESYSCPWFVADFLSPRIAHLHVSDPSINEIEMKTEDPDNQFKQFLSFGRGSQVEVTDANRRFLISVASELGNYELYFSLYDHFDGNVAVSTFCDIFKPSEIGDFISERAVNYLASHFFELDVSFVNDLPITILEEIVSNSSLTLVSEDRLYDIISSNFEKGVEFVALLEHVQFEFLSIHRFRSFVQWSCDHFEAFRS
jgi:hypothetical protein